MKLSTIACSVLGCDQEYTADLSMFWVACMAKDAGWLVEDEDGNSYCPEHNNPEDITGPLWEVGCWSCGFSEEMSEEDARYEYREHDCEADTYLKSPEELQKAKRQTSEYHDKRNVEHQELARLQEKESEQRRLRQEQLVRYANNWLKIRNAVAFWKQKEKL